MIVEGRVDRIAVVEVRLDVVDEGILGDSVESFDLSPVLPPILGGLAASSGESPYLTLLRLLTGLAEVAPASCLRAAAGELFGGSIQPPVAFDLHLVLSDATPTHRSEALHHLTWDLAQAFRTRIEEEWHLPNPVRQIGCLELDAKQFEGALSLVWSV